MKRFQKTMKNDGFSLIEVLIGVVILAIIVVPLLNGFLASAKTTKTASDVRNATVAEQNLVEKFKSLDLTNTADIYNFAAALPGIPASSGALYQKPDASSTLTQITDAGSVTADAEQYSYRFTGLSYSNSNYDAIVTLDSTQFSDINSYKVVDYKTMDAIYSQPIDASNPDALAAQQFAAQATVLSGTSVPASYFTNNMSRTITINIGKTATDSNGGIVTENVHYTYSAIYNYTNSDNQAMSAPLTADFYNEFYRDTYQNDSNEIKPIYFFYIPSYATSGDDFEINNQGNLSFSLFLIKQKTPGLSDATISVYESNYRAKVNVYQSSSAGGTVTIRSNLATNLITNTQSSFSWNLYSGYWYSGQPFESGNYQLVDTKTQNRLYGATIELYKPGKNFSADALITTFTASLAK